MDIQIEKYKLMEWLVGLKDESVISKLKSLKNSLSSSKDWSVEISETEKNSIDAGLKDIEEGRTIPHQQVMNEVKKKYGL